MASLKRARSDNDHHTEKLIVTNVEEEYNCPICFELISEAFVTRCGHSFCSKCLNRTVEQHHRCPKCQNSLASADIFPNYTLNSLIEKYRQQKPLSNEFDKQGGVVEHISNMVTNLKSLQSADLDHLINIIQEHKEKLDANSEYVHNRLLKIFLLHVHQERSSALDSLSKELSIVDYDLKQMNKRQKITSSSLPSSSAIIITTTKSLLKTDNKNQQVADRRANDGENDNAIVNDNVPIWSAIGVQDLRATPETNEEKQTNTAASTTLTSTHQVKAESIDARLASGAVVPEEKQSTTDIEHRTKIMMRFVEDLTNIYFSTRNSRRLSVDNGK
ncbi:unnamed protein product [Didymodactylos carnosus]|uniref:RING-type domain-containing protein n=1 Tax=Didymodactylos carnosus TaxID=1234261 RepID=A0A814J093_9BILA|nr:unnamed protein product [Didymodactylos carnosus]CAF1031440.1 unnamed protein product [Didymodactylos carnosus]CAF3701121.1 unnamed protein product [Didymodactylos carnosus]CAF3802262.1 unnamed protein product [Didymodactylos carnosus]